MVNSIQLKSKIERDSQTDIEVQKALEKNDTEWQKRMLLLVMIAIIALLGIN